MAHPPVLLDVDESDVAAALGATTGPAMLLARRDGVPAGSTIGERGALDAVTWRSGHELAGPTAAAIAVTIAVCTRRRPAQLSRCLESIARSVGGAGAEVVATVVVVDNDAADERTVDVARRAGVTVAREPVPGLNVARNHAVGLAQTEVVAFVDDDVSVDPTWLRTLARTFAAYPEALAVTGGVLAATVEPDARFEFERCGGFFKGWAAGTLDSSSRDDLPFNPSLGVGCNMAFRRCALQAAGPFDDALDTGPPLAGGGDLDMLLRVARLGPIVYEPSAVVRHEHRDSLAELDHQYLSWGKSWGAVLHKWYRRSPGERPVIRRAAARALRHYLHDLLLPTSPGRRRRRHAGLLLAGFAVGITVAYPRSVRRMARRRAEARAHDISAAARRRART